MGNVCGGPPTPKFNGDDFLDGFDDLDYTDGDKDEKLKAQAAPLYNDDQSDRREERKLDGKQGPADIKGVGQICMKFKSRRNKDAKAKQFSGTASLIKKVNDKRWIIITNAHNFRQTVDGDLIEPEAAMFFLNRYGMTKYQARFKVVLHKVYMENASVGEVIGNDFGLALIEYDPEKKKDGTLKNKDFDLTAIPSVFTDIKVFKGKGTDDEGEEENLGVWHDSLKDLQVLVAGYPDQVKKGAGNSWQKAGGRLYSMQGNLEFVIDTSSSKELKHKLGAYSIDTSPGNSGSPVQMQTKDDKWYTIGVHTGTGQPFKGNPNNPRQDESFLLASLVNSDVKKWIDKFIQDYGQK